MSLLLATMAMAQELPSAPAAVSQEEAQLVRQAGALGTVLFALDRAAWVSTDTLMARVARDKVSGEGGYVIERTSEDGLRVTYYRGQGDAARAFYVADVRDGRVTKDELLRKQVALTPAQAALAAARRAALLTARARGWQPCTPAPFNSIVLPSAGGSTVVYLLSAQVRTGEIPLGGHYRLVVAADGAIRSERPFSRSCLNMGPPSLPPGAPPGARPIGLVVSSVLDTIPTEMHVFSSLASGSPIYVVGNSGRMWKVAGRNVEPAALPAPQAPLTPPASPATPPAT